jgi:hypothetical protein
MKMQGSAEVSRTNPGIFSILTRLDSVRKPRKQAEDSATAEQTPGAKGASWRRRQCKITIQSK